MLFHSRMHPPRDVQTIWSGWVQTWSNEKADDCIQ
jgi:hypothetical protein